MKVSLATLLGVVTHDSGLSHRQAATAVEYLKQLAQNSAPDQTLLKINVVLALATFLTFLATAILAWKTWQLAKSTTDASALADIHHPESQSGLVVWMGKRHIDVFAERIVFSGYLRNVGPGAATTVSIFLQGPNTETDTFFGVIVPSLASGEEYPPLNGIVRAPLWAPNMPRSPVREKLIAEGMRFNVKYFTIFERERRTRYPVNGRHTDDKGQHFQYLQEMIDLNRDPRLASLVATEKKRRWPWSPR